MPFLAALTNGDPPQLEFTPTQSHMKYAKIVSGVCVFKFPKKLMFAEAIPIAEAEGYGLFKIIRRDLHTGHMVRNCESLDDFRDELTRVGYCNACERFTTGVLSDKCWKCKKPTR